MMRAPERENKLLAVRATSLNLGSGLLADAMEAGRLREFFSINPNANPKGRQLTSKIALAFSPSPLSSSPMVGRVPEKG